MSSMKGFQVKEEVEARDRGRREQEASHRITPGRGSNESRAGALSTRPYGDQAALEMSSFPFALQLHAGQDIWRRSLGFQLWGKHSLNLLRLRGNLSKGIRKSSLAQSLRTNGSQKHQHDH